MNVTEKELAYLSDDRLKQIVYLRAIKKTKWKDIYFSLGLSKAHIFRLYAKARKELEKLSNTPETNGHSKPNMQ